MLAETPQSVILYDRRGAGRSTPTSRTCKSAPTRPSARRPRWPDAGGRALQRNWARALLAPARAAGCRIATDVHAIGDLDDPYNAGFMAAADILFLSHERLPDAPEVWARAAQARYDPAALVIGLGAQGALLAPRGGPIERLPAVLTRPVVNTMGAGDALFAAFLHFHARGLAPRPALQRALIFARHKIGESGGARGFLDEAAVEALARERSGC